MTCHYKECGELRLSALPVECNESVKGVLSGIEGPIFENESYKEGIVKGVLYQKQVGVGMLNG